MWHDLEQRQPRVVHSILHAIAAGRVPHAWLFTGEPGSGLEAAALRLGAALNCPENPGVGCGVCRFCRGWLKREHYDLNWVTPSSKSRIITMDQIHEVIHWVGISPSGGGKRLVVVDQAERMGNDACNAFLKTLEEPPSHAVMVLITASPQLLLDTIRSRCVRLRFIPPTAAGCVVPEGIAPMIASLASMGRGPELSFRFSALVGKALVQIREETEERLAPLLERGLETLGEGFRVADQKKVEQEHKDLVESEYRHSRGALIEQLFFWFRDVYLVGRSMDSGLLHYTADASRVQDAAARISPKMAMACMDELERLRGQWDRSVREDVSTELAALRMFVSPSARN